MAIGTLQIEGQKFRVIPEEEYKLLRAAAKQYEREARQDAADLAEAERRMRDPKQAKAAPQSNSRLVRKAIKLTAQDRGDLAEATRRNREVIRPYAELRKELGLV